MMKPAAPAPDTPLGVVGFVVHGQDQHPDCGKANFQFLQQIETAHAFEHQIEDRHVGWGLFDRGDRLVGAGRLSANFEVRFVDNPVAEPAADDRVVIDNQNLRPASLRGGCVCTIAHYNYAPSTTEAAVFADKTTASPTRNRACQPV